MSPNLKFSALLALLTSAIIIAASPLQHQRLPRAGGPIAKPIPSNCTITNPLTSPTINSYQSTSTGTPSSPRYRPTNATSTSQLYAYYLTPDSFQVLSSNASALFTTCLDTCYGYGNPGECVSAYMAYNVPTPPMFGAPGGNPGVACLMYSRALSASDFETVPETVAGYGNSTAGDISCPSSGA